MIMVDLGILIQGGENTYDALSSCVNFHKTAL